MGFKWCNHYNCFCKDVEEIVGCDNYYCEFDCKNCDETYDVNDSKTLKADVIVFQMPVKVKITCPHCEHEIEMSYSEFEDLMGSDYPGDWNGEKIECSNCENEIEVRDNEWD